MRKNSKNKILLVEDEILIATNQQLSLEKYGYHVIIANSGEESIDLLKNDNDIELILMDINLGSGIDGTEAASQIQNQKDIPIIFLSSHTDPEIVEKTEEITSYGYVTKDSGTTVLDACIKMAFKLFKAKEEVKLNNDRFQIILKDSPVIIALTDKDARYTWIHNPHPDFDHTSPLGKRDDEIAKNEGSIRLSQIKDRVISSGVAEKEEISFPLSEGEITYEISATPLFGDTGQVIGVKSIGVDITEMKKAKNQIEQQLAEKTIILKEVHHRIKNNISSIQSLLSLQAAKSSNIETKDNIHQVINRVESMHKIYEKLLFTEEYSELSVKDYLEDLIKTIADTMPEKNKITLEIKIEDFILNIKQLFPLGTIINELLTNSFKYAFIDCSSGKIEINFSKTKNTVSLSIHDNGKGPPEDFDIEKSMGFGFTMVKAMAAQLGGKFEIENLNGTRSVITFDI